jgi:prepilin-type N-terminal cleavage/methylation domain-containing protein
MNRSRRQVQERIPPPRGGFTLVEVLVAMVVAVAAFSILAQGFTTGGHAAVAARSTTTAAGLAQRVLTDLESGVLAPDQSTSGDFDDEPDFAWSTTSAADEPGLRLITVTVKWTEQNQERTYVLTRLLRERTATP